MKHLKDPQFFKNNVCFKKKLRQSAVVYHYCGKSRAIGRSENLGVPVVIRWA